MAASPSPMAFKLVVICVAVIAILPLAAQGAITCQTVATSVVKCVPYVRDGGAVPEACCSGIKDLAGKAKTTPDRRMICVCLKSLAASLGGLQPAIVDRVAGLPAKCGVLGPYKITPSADCNKIK